VNPEPHCLRIISGEPQRPACKGRPFSNRASAVDLNYFDLIKQFIITFTGIFYEAMPWVILGSVLAGLVQELPTRWAAAIMVPVGVAILTLTILSLVPEKDRLALHTRLAYALGLAALAFGVLWMLQPLTNRLLAFLGRHRILAIGASGLLGLVLPMCECGILAVMRRLYRKGMPLSCCTAYILAGPILNAVVLSTTFVAFAYQERVTVVKGQTIINFTGIEMVWLRGLLGYLVAIGTALMVEWMYRRHGSKLLTPEIVAAAPPPRTENGNGDANGEEAEGPPVSVWRRLSNVSETALHDIVDIGVYLIIGGLLASAIRLGIEMLPQGQIIQQNSLIAIAFMMGLAFLITLCSEADAFVASTFTSIAAAPKLAFLVLGPMLDIKLFLMYLRVFRPKLMWAIILAVVVQVFLYASLTNAIWEHNAPQWFGLESVAK
jgi:uncharacterized protein